MVMSKYMHTIKGRPATFDGWQICYAVFYGPPNKLADSLKQIREEQRATIRNRKNAGFETDPSQYGHLRYS